MTTKSRQQSRHLPAFILLLLAEKPMHGGGLQTEMTTHLPLLKADSAAVYRALQQLERDGEIVAEWDTSTSGPARKVYTLTEAGWEKLSDWNADIQQRIATLRHFTERYQVLRRS